MGGQPRGSSRLLPERCSHRIDEVGLRVITARNDPVCVRERESESVPKLKIVVERVEKKEE